MQNLSLLFLERFLNLFLIKEVFVVLCFVFSARWFARYPGVDGLILRQRWLVRSVLPFPLLLLYFSVLANKTISPQSECTWAAGQKPQIK